LKQKKFRKGIDQETVCKVPNKTTEKSSSEQPIKRPTTKNQSNNADTGLILLKKSITTSINGVQTRARAKKLRSFKFF